MLYVGGVVAGVGAGIVYGTCIGNALKWFAGRRGLAAGLTSAGFGAGAAVTVIPLTIMIKNSGYQHTFLFFGILQGLVILVVLDAADHAAQGPGGGRQAQPARAAGQPRLHAGRRRWRRRCSGSCT